MALYKYWHMTDQLEANISVLVVVIWSICAGCFGQSVFKPALQLTICSCTFIPSSELRWLVSSHFMYYKVCCGCRVSQFSMFLICKLVDFSRKCYPIFQSQLLLVNIIVSSLLKLVFRVNKEKSHLFSSSCVLRMTHKCTAFFKGQRITFQVRGRRCLFLFT